MAGPESPGHGYETAAPAVPFLVAIAAAVGPPRRLKTLLLIGSIAQGSSGPPYSPADAAERARNAIGEHARVLLEAAGDQGWPFLAGVTYVVVAAAPDLAPRLT